MHRMDICSRTKCTWRNNKAAVSQTLSEKHEEKDRNESTAHRTRLSSIRHVVVNLLHAVQYHHSPAQRIRYPTNSLLTQNRLLTFGVSLPVLPICVPPPPLAWLCGDESCCFKSEIDSGHTTMETGEQRNGRAWQFPMSYIWQNVSNIYFRENLFLHFVELNGEQSECRCRRQSSVVDAVSPTLTITWAWAAQWTLNSVSILFHSAFLCCASHDYFMNSIEWKHIEWQMIENNRIRPRKHVLAHSFYAKHNTLFR